MATSGIFQLITNDGKQDEMLLAKRMLKERLNQIEAMKIANREADTSPSLDDVAETHFVPFMSKFRPVVPLAFEYQQISVPSNLSWGSEIQISIPQFGELLCDAVVVMELGAVTASNAAFWTTPGSNPVGSELISYVNHPGHAIFSRMSMEVNGNILDEYNPDIINLFYKMYVPSDKKPAWDRMVGQEQPVCGYCPVVNSSVQTGNFRNAGIRQVVSYVNGLQTPKVTQPSTVIMIPLLFWFNLDVSKALPSVAIPYGQRFYKGNLNLISNILQHHHAYNASQDNPTTNPITTPPTINKITILQNNIFTDSNVHDILIKKIGFQKIDVYRYQKQMETVATGKELLSNLKWPVSRICAMFQPVINTTWGYKGDTWNMYALPNVVTVNNSSMANAYHWNFTATTNIQASAYTASLLPSSGVAAFDFAVALGVAAATVLSVNQVNAALTLSGYPALNPATFVNPAAPTSAEIIAATPAPYNSSYYITYTPTITSMYYVAQSIPITQSGTLSQFYSDYVTWEYVNDFMRTPEDIGIYMYSFALFTNVNQPSGYLNISRSREFYINWTSNYISSATPVNMIIIAVAINFLLISDGSAVLRYAT